MTVYRTCRPCSKVSDCTIRADLAAAIKGFNVGSLTHRCNELEPLLKPGEHVWARVCAGRDPDCIYDRNLGHYIFPAVFISFAYVLDKAVIYVAQGAISKCGKRKFEAIKRNFCKVSYAPIRTPALNQWSFGPPSIVERREGYTALHICCGLPRGEPCNDDLCEHSKRIAVRPPEKNSD